MMMMVVVVMKIVVVVMMMTTHNDDDGGGDEDDGVGRDDDDYGGGECAMTEYNTTLLPSVNTLTARGMFCGAKYTHHTFTPSTKHLITTAANKNPGKKAFTDKNMKHPTGINLWW